MELYDINKSAAVNNDSYENFIEQSDNKNFRLLIIDDDRWIHRVLEKYLHAFGFETISAYDPYEGLALSIKHLPDLIFLDIIMPDIRGEFILKLIRTIEPTSKIPVIIMSGNLDKDVLGATFRNGAQGFIAKPLSRKILANKLKLVLGPDFDNQLKNTDQELFNELFHGEADSIIIV